MNTPPSNRQWFEVRAEANGAAPVEIYIYDAIYDSGCEFYGGVCPANFVEATSPYRDQAVTLRINSPGGSAFAGIAIANYLRTFSNLSAVVDGLAASAASIVFMAAPKDKRTIASGAFLMIHEPAGWAIGTAATMEKMATDLRKISDEIAALYARDTGQSLDQSKAWMKDETWFNAEEAQAAGFVASVSETPAVEARFDLTHFRHPPAAIRQPITNAMNAPEITACGCQNAGRRTTNQTSEDLASVRAERDSLRAENDRLKDSDKTARKARAVAAIDAAIGTGALPSPLRDSMIARYEEDEEGTIKALSDLRPPGPGVAPIRTRTAAAGGGPAKSMRERIAAEPDPRKRVQMYSTHWGILAEEPPEN